jgi:glycosyltransferase involved in cell wall biosynthesis
MAYGAVFVTAKDAITGGEMLNITDNETGLFYDGTISGLKEKIKFICENPIEVERIGKNAFSHYRNNRTPKIMADGIINAIEYALGGVKEKS